MTERKICEFVEGVWKKGMSTGPDDWVPLDPQPCCENCISLIEGEFCHRAGIMPSKNFYCSYWQVKE